MNEIQDGHLCTVHVRKRHGSTGIVSGNKSWDGEDSIHKMLWKVCVLVVGRNCANHLCLCCQEYDCLMLQARRGIQFMKYPFSYQLRDGIGVALLKCDTVKGQGGEYLIDVGFQVGGGFLFRARVTLEINSKNSCFGDAFVSDFLNLAFADTVHVLSRTEALMFICFQSAAGLMFLGMFWHLNNSNLDGMS